MPEVLRGCPVGDGNNPEHCYCGMDNMCCYCRLPLDQARDQQAPSLTTTAQQYRARYASPSYGNSNWYIETANTTQQTISWTSITASDAILENQIFTEMISAPEDDGSEEIKD